MTDRLLTVKDVMERLAVSQRTLRYWIAERGLPHLLLDKKTLRIPESDLDAWIRRNEDKRSMAARWRLLAWALQRSPELVTLMTERPASVAYWCMGQVPALTLSGKRVPFTPEALKEMVGVSPDAMVLAPPEPTMTKTVPGAPSGHAPSRTVKAS